MAEDLTKLRAQAEKHFPGDRTRQDAFVNALTLPPTSSTTKKRASTAKKKTVKPAPPAKPKRRRL
jgi:hypothetical protein